MSPPRSWSAALAVALLVPLAGCNAKPELPQEWQGRDLGAPGWANVTIQQNWSYGMEYYLPAGRSIEWDWVALTQGALYFQLTRAGGALPLREEHGNAGTGKFTTTVTGVYTLAWSLEGLPTTELHVKLPEGGLEHHWPPGEGPGCLLAAGLC